MRITVYTLLIAAACFAGQATLTGCKNNDRAELAHHHDHHECEEGGHGGEIVLEPAQAAALGVKTAAVQPAPFNTVIKVAGRLLPSTDGVSVAAAPKAGIVTLSSGIALGSKVNAGAVIATIKSTGMSGGDANAAAKAAYQAAQREVERLTPLHDAGIVSTADFNAAVAARDVARANYSPNASNGVVTAKSSGTITALAVQTGQFVDAGATVADISASNKLLLQADLPQRYSSELAKINGAKIQPAYADSVINLGQMGLQRSTGTATPRGGYVPVYFTFTNKAGLLPDTPVEVFLETSSRENVISVPLGAVSEQQGNYFVYQQLDEECYKKLPVTLGPSDGERVEILKGLQPGTKIVVAGAKILHLSETSSAVPEGHSHQH